MWILEGESGCQGVVGNSVSSYSSMFMLDREIYGDMSWCLSPMRKCVHEGMTNGHESSNLEFRCSWMSWSSSLSFSAWFLDSYAVERQKYIARVFRKCGSRKWYSPISEEHYSHQRRISRIKNGKLHKITFFF